MDVTQPKIQAVPRKSRHAHQTGKPVNPVRRPGRYTGEMLREIRKSAQDQERQRRIRQAGAIGYRRGRTAALRMWPTPNVLPYRGPLHFGGV